MNRQLTLTSKHLTLSPPDIAMADELNLLHQNNRHHFRLGSPDAILKQSADIFWRNKLRQEQLWFEQDFQYNWYGRIKESDTLICHIQVSNIVRGVLYAAQIGYKIDQNFEGRGLMSEAVQLVIDWLFSELNLHRIIANYQPENLASARLLSRLGFQIEGFAKDYLYLDGEWKDHVLTALINPDFDSSKL